MGRNFYAIHQSATCLSGEELQRYLDGASSPQERRRVENHLLDCPLCSDAVEGFESLGQAQLLHVEDFSQFKKKLPLPEGAIVRQLTPTRMLMRAAAAIALLLVAVWGFNNLAGGTSSNELYRMGYSSYPMEIPYERRGVGELSQAAVAALADYDSGHYAQSLPKFQQALNEEPDNHALNFYAGLAALETSNWQDAVKQLSRAGSTPGIFSEQAKWYLALANLKAGNVNEAKALLDTVKAKGKYKSAEAQKLLDKM